MRKFKLPLLLLVLASIPGTLGLAEEAGGNPATAVAAVTSVAANAPAPVAAALPDWANLPTQTPAPQTPQGIDDKPVFLITCSSCRTSPRCSSFHDCVLMGCC
ncbi:MAG TPA: hypothetical protein VGM86_29695 [Thermoanaerobaculia bacterium]|jgi:hypothetical protein